MGGLSHSPYNELNLGFSSGDDLNIIKRNRKLFFDALGISEGDIAWSKLVHGNKVLVADKPIKGEDCDAVITNKPNVFACVSIADCTPVLICDAKNKAVAAIHAGWRGTAANIVTETLKAMQTNYGTKGEDCLAFIGACIGEQNFEVGEEVAAQFSDDVKRFDSSKQKYFVDLKKENKKQLLQFGLKENNIEISKYCTIADNDKFFSYRKENGVTGRMLAVIGIKNLDLRIMNLDEESIFDNEDDDDFERLQKRNRNLPVYKKAMEIVKTARLLGSTLEGDDKEMYEFHLNESAMIMPAKIAGAIGSGSWLIAMQNAAIVRYHAEWLLTATSGLKHMTKADKDYVKVLRSEMEEFRDLFNEWIKEIHKMDKDDFEDEWGLFIK